MTSTVQEPAALEIPVLEIAPLDTDGRLLRLHCESTTHSAVATETVRLGEDLLRLDILSASHRVSIASRTSPSSVAPAWDVHETVACGSIGAEQCTSLPDHLQWSSGPWNLLFASSLSVGVESIDAADCDIGSAVERPGCVSIARRFPGHSLAVTALVASAPAPDQLIWTSWHLYPGPDPHVVTTHTEAQRFSGAV